jgi:hypothetical protein
MDAARAKENPAKNSGPREYGANLLALTPA